MKHWFYHSLGFRLLIYILLISTIITCGQTALQLFMDYRYEQKKIQQNFQLVEDSYLESLTYALWIDDQEQIAHHLAGIGRLPDIQYCEISKDQSILARYGLELHRQALDHDYVLTYLYNGVNYKLGTLKVMASLENINRMITDRVFFILVSLAIYFCFYLLIGRHLKTLADYTRDLNVGRLYQAPPSSSSIHIGIGRT